MRVLRSSSSRSSSVVRGVIRSTIELGNGTCASIHWANSGSFCRVLCP